MNSLITKELSNKLKFRQMRTEDTVGSLEKWTRTMKCYLQRKNYNKESLLHHLGLQWEEWVNWLIARKKHHNKCLLKKLTILVSKRKVKEISLTFTTLLYKRKNRLKNITYTTATSWSLTTCLDRKTHNFIVG